MHHKAITLVLGLVVPAAFHSMIARHSQKSLCHGTMGEGTKVVWDGKEGISVFSLHTKPFLLNLVFLLPLFFFIIISKSKIKTWRFGYWKLLLSGFDFRSPLYPPFLLD